MAGFTTGQVSISGTRAQLTSDTSLEPGVLLVKAPRDNSNPVYIGDDTVTTSTGFEIAAGEEFSLVYTNKEGIPLIDIRPSDLYVIGTAGSDKVTWIASLR